MTHVCGVPRAIQWAFKLCKPFMSKEAYDAMQLRVDFSHLPKCLPPGSLLKEWGGEVEFDLTQYVEWRAKEEGVTIDPNIVKRSLFCPHAHHENRAGVGQLKRDRRIETP